MSNNNDDTTPDHPTRRLDDNDQNFPQEQATQRLPNPAQAFYIGDGTSVVSARLPKVCPDCGGDLIWAKTQADRSVLRVISLSGPGILNQHRSDVAVVVCSECGLTRFYTLNPDRVRER